MPLWRALADNLLILSSIICEEIRNDSNIDILNTPTYGEGFSIFSILGP